MTRLLCFGHGYSAGAFAANCVENGWHVSGTTRSNARVDQIKATGTEPLLFNGTEASPAVSASVANATHILVSIAPGSNGDAVLRYHLDGLGRSSNLQWVGYLSTVGVYGNHNGGWIDEQTPPAPTSERSKHRMAAERAWQEFCGSKAIPLQIFRLSGIYGPGRSAIDKLAAGSARRLIKPGQVFNRIHVGDIAGALAAGTANPRATGIFNVTDDLPAPPQDVVQFAAELTGHAVPPDVDFETADLTPMARSFYAENKRVGNGKIKRELGMTFKYPTYREGIAAIAAQT